MSENTIFMLVTVIVILIVAALWLAMVTFVYRDSKRRGMAGMSRLVWVLLSLFPLLGFLAYLMMHSDDTRFLSSEQRNLPTSPKQKPKTQPLKRNQPAKKRTRTPQQYLREEMKMKMTSDSEPNNGRKRITVQPHNESKKRRTAPPSMGIRVTVTSGPGVIRHPAELSFGDTLIGAVAPSQAESGITIEGDHSISGSHARISVSAQEMTLENLSRFGTWVNAQHLSSVGETIQLPPDSQIRVGNTYLSLAEPDTNSNPSETNSPQTQFWNGQANKAGAYLLSVEEGPHQGQQFAINQLPTTLGRAATCAIRLHQDLCVSREHAELYQQGKILRLRDLDSRRGTNVNGYDIEDKVIEQGDKILLGDSLLVLKSERRGT